MVELGGVAPGLEKVDDGVEWAAETGERAHFVRPIRKAGDRTDLGKSNRCDLGLLLAVRTGS